MAEVKWIKIVTDIFDDEKILLIESMPEADSVIVIWFKLLCLAGKQNNSGVFTMSNGIPYTQDMLTTIFRRKETVVSLALATFQRFGMIEIVDQAITIPNWGKHQNLDKIEAKNEYQRNYMREYRARQKLLIARDEMGKSNHKTNSKANVSPLDKNRIREDIEEINNIKDIICSEPEKSAPSLSGILIPLNDKTFFNIPVDNIALWQDAYPAVAIEQELKRMISWLESNPTKKKTKRGIKRFINNWLSRTQDAGGSKTSSGSKNELEDWINE